MGSRLSRQPNIFDRIVLQRDEEEKYAELLQKWEAAQVHLVAMEERVEKKSKKKRRFFRKRARKEIQRQKEILDAVWDIRNEFVSEMKKQRLVAYYRIQNQEKKEQIERERKLLEDAQERLKEKIKQREAAESCKEWIKERKACQGEDEVIEREMAERREKITQIRMRSAQRREERAALQKDRSFGDYFAKLKAMAKIE
ncbi:meiosis-specific nuclear structural protein 1-like [Ptychodera flava]|uniref:meiosis-specific nuclear structural protein 1-like n=1 Tax=Ptychodera flava TaxID=63121 RepID=UPI00396AB0A9